MIFASGFVSQTFFARKDKGFAKQKFLHHIQLLSQRADKNFS